MGNSPETVQAVWRMARIVEGKDPDVQRIDAFGSLIGRDQYGDMNTEGDGWEVDHVRPVAEGGTDGLDNLQPLHWEKNKWKADIWPDW